MHFQQLSIEVSQSMRDSIGAIIRAEEFKGHKLMNRQANMLQKKEFIDKVDKARFVVILPSESHGTGIVLR